MNEFVAERVCSFCQTHVENEISVIIKCEAYDTIRESLIKYPD